MKPAAPARAVWLRTAHPCLATHCLARLASPSYHHGKHLKETLQSTNRRLQRARALLLHADLDELDVPTPTLKRNVRTAVAYVPPYNCVHVRIRPHPRHATTHLALVLCQTADGSFLVRCAELSVWNFAIHANRVYAAMMREQRKASPKRSPIQSRSIPASASSVRGDASYAGSHAGASTAASSAVTPGRSYVLTSWHIGVVGCVASVAAHSPAPAPVPCRLPLRPTTTDLGTECHTRSL